MNQKKELPVKNLPMEIASVILGQEDNESQKLVKLTTLIKKNTIDLSAKLSLFSGQTCLHLAAEKNFIQIARLLIDSGANINALDWADLTPAHNAARCGLHDMLILFHNANLDVCGGKRLETPLHIAVRKNFPACVEVLMSFAKPANCLVKNYTDKTPIALIDDFNDDHTKMVLNRAFIPTTELKGLNKILVDKKGKDVLAYVLSGLPVGVTYANQNSAIIVAADEGLVEILLLLCQQPDIDMNAVDKDGETALHKSIRKKHVACIKVLVTSLKPINRHCRNALGQKAEDLILDDEDSLVLREALVYMPAKKRNPEFETTFFSTGGITKLSSNPANSLPECLKYLEFSKRNKPVNSIPHETRKITVEYKSVSNPDFEKWYSISAVKSAKYHTNDLVKMDEIKLHKLLLMHGLDDSYPTSEVFFLNQGDFQQVAQIFKMDESCLTFVYDLCTGDIINNRLQINISNIFASTLGLLSLYKPVEIVEAIMMLSPKFCNHQHLIGNILIKNIFFLYCEFGYDLSEKTFTKVIHLYLKKHCLKEISNTLSIIFNRINERDSHPLYTAFKSREISSPGSDAEEITEKIQNVIDKKDAIKKDDLRYIASEISNLSMGFYQQCMLKSLNETNDKKHIVDTFSSLKDRFNLLTSFIKHTVLKQNTAKARARALTLFILTAKDCLHLQSPDLNAMVFIMSAISSTSISRLKNSFQCIDKKTLKIMNALKSVCSSDGNYKKLRELSKNFPGSLPYIGVLLKDIYMMSQAGFSIDNICVLGEIYRPVFEIKKQIEFSEIIYKSDLIYQLEKFALFDGEIFHKMSFLYEPEVLDFSSTVTVKGFNEMFIKYKNLNIPLMLIKDSKCVQGSKALDVISNWLDIMVENEQLDTTESEGIYNVCKTYIADFSKENYVNKIEHTNSRFKFFVDETPLISLNTDETLDFSAK